MSHTVTLYFDNMIDETHYFENEEEAEKMYRSLELCYTRNRLYRVVKEEIPEQGGERIEMMIDEIKEALKHYHNAISGLSAFDIEEHCDCAESCIAVIKRIVGYDRKNVH